MENDLDKFLSDTIKTPPDKGINTENFFETLTEEDIYASNKQGNTHQDDQIIITNIKKTTKGREVGINIKMI